MKTITVLEHEILMIGSVFREKHFNCLAKWNGRNEIKRITLLHEGVKFKQYVGIIQVMDVTIEVLPKISDKDDATSAKTVSSKVLMAMIKAVHYQKYYRATQAQLHVASTSLHDFFIREFFTELEMIITKGLCRSYQSLKKNNLAIKGKILFNENIKRNAYRNDKHVTKHQSYDYRTIHNSVLLSALAALNKYKQLNLPLQNKCRQHYEYLSDLEIKPLLAAQIPWKKLIINRNNQHYKQALIYAKMIIAYLNPHAQTGDNEVVSILFDMNSLFESYITIQCNRACSDIGSAITVESQESKKFFESCQIRPDLVFQLQNQQEENIIADVKWKRVESAPSTEDLKQMYVYNQYWDAKRAFLIYPKAGGLGEDSGSFYINNIDKVSRSVTLLPVSLVAKDKKVNKNIGKDILDSIYSSIKV